MRAVVTSFLIVAGLLGLGGCHRSDELVPAHTLAWLHGTQGELLRFRQPGTGAIDTLRIERYEIKEVISGGGKVPVFGTSYRQSFDLQYVHRLVPGTTEAQGLRVEFVGGGLAFGFLPASNYARVAGLSINDVDPDGRPAAEASYATIELLATVQLNGNMYPHVAHVRLVSPPTPHDYTELWYAKDTGLVAYGRSDGSVWYRL